ncbi:MAG: SGNH/GDSL hydrolase family protein [Candidatus Bathyarchaeia archaeon]|jgi:lysophospholipase L1-like esterase
MIWHRQLITNHPTIGWWWIPNLKSMIIGEHLYLLRTNSVGMRSDREYPLKRPEDRHRIVILGDSQTAGQGVTNSDRFSDLLEKSYPNLDVMNFGLYGSGTDQQLLIYETLAKSFEANAYIFAPYWNNIARNMVDLFVFRRQGSLGDRKVTWMPKPYFLLEGDHLALCNTPVPARPVSEEVAAKHLGISERWGVADTTVFSLPWKTPNPLRTKLWFALSKPYSGYESDESRSWRLMRAILERFIGEVDGKPVFIVPLPSYHHYSFGVAPTYLARYEKLHNPSKNCFVVDPLPYFKRLSHEQRRRCSGEQDYTHYSPFGHKILAEAISDAFETHCPAIVK